MSKHYCPAGKCECEVYSSDNSASGHCQASFVDRRWEHCPWPSRQVKMETNAIGYPGPDDDPLIDAHKQGFAAGLVHQARVDREAIDKVDDGELYRQILDDCGKCGNIEGPCNMPECAHFTVMLIHAIDIDKMIAALAAVAPEEKHG